MSIEDQRNRGTEKQWEQRTSGYRGPVGTEDQRNSGNRGPVGTEDQCNSGPRGPEKQWEQRTSGYRGPVGTSSCYRKFVFATRKKNDTTYLVDKMFVTSIIRTIIKCEEIKLSCQNYCYDILKTKKLAIC